MLTKKKQSKNVRSTMEPNSILLDQKLKWAENPLLSSPKKKFNKRQSCPYTRKIKSNDLYKLELNEKENKIEKGKEENKMDKKIKIKEVIAHINHLNIKLKNMIF